ncbi:MAG: hypothetical protein R2746_12335 [Acidimicrobiales bacterium]
MGVTPGVGVALALSLGDALATGFALAAVAAALRHRWAWMTVALVAGALTRETLLLVAVGLVFTAAMPWRWRAAALAVPALAIGSWVLWSTQQIGAPRCRAPPSSPSPPRLDPLHEPAVGPGPRAGPARAARGRCPPHVAHRSRRGRGARPDAALMACLATDVTVSWLNTTRVAAPVTALAVWAVVARGAPAEEPASVGSPAMQTSGPTPQLAGAR